MGVKDKLVEEKMHVAALVISQEVSRTLGVLCQELGTESKITVFFKLSTMAFHVPSKHTVSSRMVIEVCAQKKLARRKRARVDGKT